MRKFSLVKRKRRTHTYRVVPSASGITYRRQTVLHPLAQGGMAGPKKAAEKLGSGGYTKSGVRIETTGFCRWQTVGAAGV
jgi:hypothetical protein